MNLDVELILKIIDALGRKEDVMQYNIIGDSLPVLLLQLEQGETVQCESGAMSWMDKGIRMDTKAGGIGKAVGRMFSGESLFLNHYHAEQAGELALAATFPGSIRAIEVTPDRSIVAQKKCIFGYDWQCKYVCFLSEKDWSRFSRWRRIHHAEV